MFSNFFAYHVMRLFKLLVVMLMFYLLRLMLLIIKSCYDKLHIVVLMFKFEEVAAAVVFWLGLDGVVLLCFSVYTSYFNHTPRLLLEVCTEMQTNL